jgi:hypothetical protein
MRLAGKICARCRLSLPSPHTPGERLCSKCQGGTMHRVYMHFMLRDGWCCQFMDDDVPVCVSLLRFGPPKINCMAVGQRWPFSGLLSAPMTDSRLQWFTRRATVRESASPYRPFRLLPRTLRPLQPLPGLRNSGHSLCPFLARRGAIVSGFLRRPGSERLF